MKLTLTSTLLALSLLGAGSVALADDAMMAKPSTMATMVCRPAKAGETATAMTMSKTELVCKPLDMKPVMAIKKDVEAMSNGGLMWQNLLMSMDLQQSPR